MIKWLNNNQGFVIIILTTCYVIFTGWIILEMRGDRKERKRKENEPYFKNLFNKAQNTLFKEIKKVVACVIKIKEELTDLDIGKMLKKLHHQQFIKAITLPPDEREEIASKIQEESLSRLGKLPEKQLQCINDFFKIHSLKYDKILQKSLMKIRDNSEKLQHVRSKYNDLILPLTSSYLSCILLHKAGYEMHPQLVEKVKKIFEKYIGEKTNIEDLAKKRRYKNDIINTKKKILKLIRKTEKYNKKFVKRAQFYSIKYAALSNG